MFVSDAPKSLEDAKKYRYNRWAGNPKGNPYDPECCAFDVYDQTSRGFYQCSRKPGNGPAGLYCKQHARMIEQG